MAQQEQLPNSIVKFLLLILVTLCQACDIAVDEPVQVILLPNASLIVRKDTVFLKEGKKFGGTVLQLNENGRDTLLVASYKNGVPHGLLKAWYTNGKPKEYREYYKGMKHGTQIVYWENGNKKFEFTAHEDRYEGKLLEWDEGGRLFHEGNFKSGQEEGAQKMWYPNGKIRSNYVVVNGKRYGLLGTKNCKNVSDSIFVSATF